MLWGIGGSISCASLRKSLGLSGLKSFDDYPALVFGLGKFGDR